MVVGRLHVRDVVRGDTVLRRITGGNLRKNHESQSNAHIFANLVKLCSVQKNGFLAIHFHNLINFQKLYVIMLNLLRIL